jgi:hypothetical protein
VLRTIITYFSPKRIVGRKSPYSYYHQIMSTFSGPTFFEVFEDVLELDYHYEWSDEYKEYHFFNKNN